MKFEKIVKFRFSRVHVGLVRSVHGPRSQKWERRKTKSTFFPNKFMRYTDPGNGGLYVTRTPGTGGYTGWDFSDALHGPRKKNSPTDNGPRCFQSTSNAHQKEWKYEKTCSILAHLKLSLIVLKFISASFFWKCWKRYIGPGGGVITPDLEM